MVPPPRTNYGCHKRSPPAITGPGRTIRGNKIIIVKKGSAIIFGCRLIRRSRNILAIYELPSSNEDQMEFRYKHWCGRAERGRTCAPPCRRYSGTVVGPVTARADQLWHAETGPPDQIWRRTNYCVTVQLEPYGAHSASRPITRCILRCILQKVHKLIKRYRFGSMTLTIEICSGQIFHSKDGLP